MALLVTLRPVTNPFQYLQGVRRGARAKALFKCPVLFPLTCMILEMITFEMGC